MTIQFTEIGSDVWIPLFAEPKRQEGESSKAFAARQKAYRAKAAPLKIGITLLGDEEIRGIEREMDAVVHAEEVRLAELRKEHPDARHLEAENFRTPEGNREFRAALRSGVLRMFRGLRGAQIGRRKSDTVEPAEALEYLAKANLLEHLYERCLIAQSPLSTELFC